MEEVVVDCLRIDPQQRTVWFETKEVDLTTAEFDLLYFLVPCRNVLSRQVIFRGNHGNAIRGLDRSIDLRISRLRKNPGMTPLRARSNLSEVGYMLSTEL